MRTIKSEIAQFLNFSKHGTFIIIGKSTNTVKGEHDIFRYITVTQKSHVTYIHAIFTYEYSMYLQLKVNFPQRKHEPTFAKSA